MNTLNIEFSQRGNVMKYRKMFISWLVGLVLFIQFFNIQAQDIPAELIHYPDFVFFNGQVLTADADQDFTIAQAVAVRGNRIFAVVPANVLADWQDLIPASLILMVVQSRPGLSITMATIRYLQGIFSRTANGVA
jgi:hypothetical protein